MTSSGFPEGSFVKRYKNILRELKKTLEQSTNIDTLQMHMEHFINANRQVTWPHKTTGVFHKDEAEKAVDKAVKEYERYIRDGKCHPEVLPDLMNAISLVETMIGELKDH